MGEAPQERLELGWHFETTNAGLGLGVGDPEQPSVIVQVSDRALQGRELGLSLANTYLSMSVEELEEWMDFISQHI